MSALTKSLLLFLLNWLDAQLTLLWVRAGLATEGNGLMGRLLEAGNAPFLLTKLAVGACVAYALYRWAHLPLAQRGMKLVLGLYIGLMFVHAATGLSAFGLPAPDALAYLVHLSNNLTLALF
ncbi:MAG TPA: DUF5658 family protein [Pyrinomonadaceae bacterium]|nr:DUF5658 family protein [Pyrinomonadaceae bacterium]